MNIASICPAKTAYLLGNGPSRAQFNLAAAVDADLYGCNLSDSALPLRATFVMDMVLLEHLQVTRQRLPWPIILAYSLEKVLDRIDPRPEIAGIIPARINNGENTGQHALTWLMNAGYTTIHLYGFDSLVCDNVTSDSHTRVRGSVHDDKHAAIWRKNFIRIFADAQTRGITITANGRPAPTT